MVSRGVSIAILGVLLSAGPAVTWSVTPPGNAVRGKRLFVKEGCASCHGTTGAGSLVSAPRIAPDPVSWMAFIRQLRHPYDSGRYGSLGMPMFGRSLLTDAQAADIYAYLTSIRPGPTAAQIPLLGK